MEGYESSANITSDEAYVDVSDLDSDKSSAFQDSMAKIRRNNRLDLQELMIIACQLDACAETMHNISRHAMCMNYSESEGNEPINEAKWAKPGPGDM